MPREALNDAAGEALIHGVKEGAAQDNQGGAEAEEAAYDQSTGSLKEGAAEGEVKEEARRHASSLVLQALRLKLLDRVDGVGVAEAAGLSVQLSKICISVQGLSASKEGRFSFAIVFIGYTGLGGANLLTSLIAIEADTLGAEVGIDDVVLISLADRLIGALRLTGSTVDAIVGDDGGHVFLLALNIWASLARSKNEASMHRRAALDKKEMRAF